MPSLGHRRSLAFATSLYGGTALVQHPDTAANSWMPREAILRDYPEVISVKQIADRVHSFSFGKHFARAGRHKVALLGI